MSHKQLGKVRQTQEKGNQGPAGPCYRRGNEQILTPARAGNSGQCLHVFRGSEHRSTAATLACGLLDQAGMDPVLSLFLLSLFISIRVKEAAAPGQLPTVDTRQEGASPLLLRGLPKEEDCRIQVWKGSAFLWSLERASWRLEISLMCVLEEEQILLVSREPGCATLHILVFNHLLNCCFLGHKREIIMPICPSVSGMRWRCNNHVLYEQTSQ